jgi:hypothetical protein
MHTKFLSENLKRSCGRPRGRWEDKIRIYLREIGQRPVAGSCKTYRNAAEFYAVLSASVRTTYGLNYIPDRAFLFA